MSNKQIFINQDEISYYLKDIRKKTVLTPKREKELAQLMLSPDLSPEKKRGSGKRNLRGKFKVCYFYRKRLPRTRS